VHQYKQCNTGTVEEFHHTKNIETDHGLNLGQIEVSVEISKPSRVSLKLRQIPRRRFNFNSKIPSNLQILSR
jgi:hypothetical protein